MPIIPREPIIEPLSPRVNIERNLFTPKFSSLKDKRTSKVVPLTDHRSWTVDESDSSKEELVTKKEKFTGPKTNSNSLPSSLFPNQLHRPAASPCQSSWMFPSPLTMVNSCCWMCSRETVHVKNRKLLPKVKFMEFSTLPFSLTWPAMQGKFYLFHYFKLSSSRVGIIASILRQKYKQSSTFASSFPNRDKSSFDENFLIFS